MNQDPSRKEKHAGQKQQAQWRKYTDRSEEHSRDKKDTKVEGHLQVPFWNTVGRDLNLWNSVNLRVWTLTRYSPATETAA